MYRFTVMDIYKISYMWYGLIAMVVAFIVAIPVSLLTGYQRGGELEPGLIYSLPDEWCCCCPESCRGHCRCGVPNQDDLDHSTVSLNLVFICHTFMRVNNFGILWRRLIWFFSGRQATDFTFILLCGWLRRPLDENSSILVIGHTCYIVIFTATFWNTDRDRTMYSNKI